MGPGTRGPGLFTFPSFFSGVQGSALDQTTKLRLGLKTFKLFLDEIPIVFFRTPRKKKLEIFIWPCVVESAPSEDLEQLKGPAKSPPGLPRVMVMASAARALGRVAWRTCWPMD